MVNIGKYWRIFLCVVFIPVPSVIGGTLGKAEKGGKGGKTGIEGIDDIAGIDGTDGIGETGVTDGTEAVDVEARVEGKECIAGMGIGGIIVPITGRTGTAEKVKKNYYFVSDQGDKECFLQCIHQKKLLQKLLNRAQMRCNQKSLSC